MPCMIGLQVTVQLTTNIALSVGSTVISGHIFYVTCAGVKYCAVLNAWYGFAAAALNVSIITYLVYVSLIIF